MKSNFIVPVMVKFRNNKALIVKFNHIATEFCMVQTKGLVLISASKP